MADTSEVQHTESTQEAGRLAPDVEQYILRAISRIDYGSVEVVIHDGRVVQVECREKIRVARDEPARKGAVRPIR